MQHVFDDTIIAGEGGHDSEYFLFENHILWFKKKKKKKKQQQQANKQILSMIKDVSYSSTRPFLFFLFGTEFLR